MLIPIAQKMLNEQIAASTVATERLRELEGKSFAVVIKGSDVRIVAWAQAGEIQLASSEARADVELTAGIADLIRLSRSSGLGDLRSVGASLNGEIHVAEGFADLMQHAVPEPEAWLADWIGDIPAHAIGQSTRAVGHWLHRAGRAFEQNLAEYLQEETPNLIPPPLSREFSKAVDRIRDDVDRAERRIERLEKRRLG